MEITTSDQSLGSFGATTRVRFAGLPGNPKLRRGNPCGCPLLRAHQRAATRAARTSRIEIGYVLPERNVLLGRKLFLPTLTFTRLAHKSSEPPFRRPGHEQGHGRFLSRWSRSLECGGLPPLVRRRRYHRGMQSKRSKLSRPPKRSDEARASSRTPDCMHRIMMTTMYGRYLQTAELSKNERTLNPLQSRESPSILAQKSADATEYHCVHDREATSSRTLRFRVSNRETARFFPTRFGIISR